MSAHESIIVAYAITFLFVGGLLVVSLMRSRRVKRALAAQDKPRP